MSEESWINRTHAKNLAFAKKGKNARWFSALILVLVSMHLFLTNPDQSVWHLVIGGVFALGMILPILQLPLLYIWMWIGNVLGEISSTAVLGVIYFLLLLPISLFVKNKNVEPGWKAKNEFSPHDNLY